MNKLTKLTLLGALFFIVTGALGIIGIVGIADAQELIQEDLSQTQQGEEQSQEITQDEQSAENKEETTNTYNYVAQHGDSYTLMARKAVQTYGIINEVDLSEAQIIFAETNITLSAGSPLLTVDEKVQISEDIVRDWVDQARKLTEEDQALWAQYAVNANFNTNAVGEVVS